MAFDGLLMDGGCKQTPIWINSHLQKISDNLVKQLDKSIVVLNRQLWNQVEHEVKAQEVCNVVVRVNTHY